MVILAKGNINLDSTLVFNEKFYFTGKVVEPFHAFLMLPTTGDYTTLWLENSDIALYAEKGKFEDRIISGSDSQRDFEKLEVKITRIEKLRDSVRSLTENSNLSDTEKISRKIYLDNLQKMENKVTQDFVSENPNSVVSSFVLNFYKTTWGKNVTEKLYEKLALDRRESKDGIIISRYIELNNDPRIGDQYTDFEMSNARGEIVRLSDYMGKYTLLQFWASHCFYSVQENPNLVKNYETFKNQGFNILGVSLNDDYSTFLNSLKENNFAWENLMSSSGRDNDAALIYGINSTPDNFLIDANAIITGRNIRGEKLSKKLKELMPKIEEKN